MASLTNDELVSAHTTWVSKTPERQLNELLLVQLDSGADLKMVHRENSSKCDPLYLEQVQEDSPCLLTLRCSPHFPAAITSLLISSHARTLEVYSLTGEYCGTCRGEEDHNVHFERADEGVPFYKKHLVLECPSSSCDVKLLSLGGRTRLAIAGVVLGLRSLEPAAGSLNGGVSIDLLRVQSMMQEMGTTLSPGAQSLMDMVQFQQKNKADVLGGFLPLLLGSGPLAALCHGGPGSPAAVGARPQPALSGRPSGAPQHPEGFASIEADTAEDRSLGPHVRSAATGPPPLVVDNPAQLIQQMSSLLGGQPGQPVCGAPGFLSVLQAACGQVTTQRVGKATAPENVAINGLTEEHVCCRAVEKALVRRMDEMERRLMEHMDQRMDALQQTLERAQLQPPSLAQVFTSCEPDHVNKTQSHH